MPKGAMTLFRRECSTAAFACSRFYVMFSPFYTICVHESIVAGVLGFYFFYSLCVHDRFPLVNSSCCFFVCCALVMNIASLLGD